MKALRVHISTLLIGAVLFSIVFRSFHTIDHASHLIPIPTEKQTALHTPVDKCPVCDFKLSVFNTPEILNFTPVNIIVQTEHLVLHTSPDLSAYLQGYSLRGPPSSWS
ncbi:hypothetical protein [Sinomicrobium sp.]